MQLVETPAKIVNLLYMNVARKVHGIGGFYYVIDG